MSEAYLTLGVSSTKEEIHRAIEKQDKGVFAGAFCKLIADPCGDDDYCAVMHADGAGTKASLAYLKFRETGDFSAYHDIAQDSMVMNLDDVMCVGATGPFVLSNTIDRNAHRVDGNAIRAVIDGYSDFTANMRNFGVDITMSGGETADVGDLASTLIVNSTLFVRMKREDVIDCDRITAGDVIVGFASYGQADYESRYNAGMGSNGLTAARHLLLCHDYADKYPESYSDTIDRSKVYCGAYRLEDELPGAPVNVGDAMLSPTRTYAPVIMEMMRTAKEGIHGMVHCTGGGQVKCRNFGHDVHYIKDNLFPVPPLFQAIAKNSDIAQREMYQVFNMGHRLEVFCPSEYADAMIAAGQKFGVEARIIGRVEASNDGVNHVTIQVDGETFEY